MAIYTGTGDDGSTSLGGGARTTKTDPRIEACGALDELNCALGLAATACGFAELTGVIAELQSHLLELGAQLARPREGSCRHAPGGITQAHVDRLERIIDRISESLAPLAGFVLPGGSDPAARLHLARAVCRRAERRMIALAQRQDVGAIPLAFINRLSDLLFVMARRANQLAGVPDIKRPGPRSA